MSHGMDSSIRVIEAAQTYQTRKPPLGWSDKTSPNRSASTASKPSSAGLAELSPGRIENPKLTSYCISLILKA